MHIVEPPLMAIPQQKEPSNSHTFDIAKDQFY